jgi:hypothetical protein
MVYNYISILKSFICLVKQVNLTDLKLFHKGTKLV